MHLLSILLFAMSANIDNFTVGIAYGIKRIKIKILSNLIIATISGIGTFISMSLGLLISRFLSPTVANIIGCIILIGIGIWLIIDFFIKNNNNSIKDFSTDKKATTILDNPEKADIDNSGTIDIRESIVLAFALTINNFGLGIGASITGMNILLTTLFTFIFSILSIILGCFAGKSYLSKIFGKFAPIVSALIILVLGIYEMFI